MKNVSFFSVLVCDLKRGCLRVAKWRFRHAKEPFYDPQSATFQKQTTSLKKSISFKRVINTTCVIVLN